MKTSFYPEFKRHAGGEGLKAKSTHYCPGCGHGLAQKFISEAITNLGIQDKTIMISPVGCSVFLFYYMDTGNSQAAHGRAPAVAIGHKTANPESIVISYQGDGDLASIGLAEIIQAAQLGLPITVIFANNAIYGMTGGQLAPTSLDGMITTTTPTGRKEINGHPLRMAEMIAQIDGAIYVERVALYDSKQRMKAKKAIEKGIRLQVENKGFSFIEVLSECPTHLKKTPAEAQTWIKEMMVPQFPLGVKKDTTPEHDFQFSKPDFSAERFTSVLHAPNKPAEKFSGKFPTSIDHEDVGIKFAGSGGDGAQTAALLLTKAAINEGFDSTHIPSYGPESRGGTSYADVHIAQTEVLSPLVSDPHILVVFNSPSMIKFAPTVRKGGLIIYDSSLIHDIPSIDQSVRTIGVPFSEIAQTVGNRMVKNIVALGALQASVNLFSTETFLSIIKDMLKSKKDLISMNEEAFLLGKQSAMR